jgi:tripartite-type tricarboxylate transporter receptor subunit TctC
MQRRQFINGLGVIPALAIPGLAQAKTQSQWPNRNVRIIVPWPAGGSSDIIGRSISPGLSQALKQGVLVDDRPGAGGNLGAAMVAQKGSDDHTLLMCDVGILVISPSVYKNLTFDPNKDLRGVSLLAYSPHMLAVHPSVPANNLSELVALSKHKPISIAIGGMGSAPHLAAVSVEQTTGLRWQYVPYKGGAQALTDTIGGQTQAIMNGLLPLFPQLQSGRLKPIAVSKLTRMAVLPNVPTLAESGMPGFESGSFQGLMAQASLPTEAVERLSNALARIINSPDIKKKLAEQGAEVRTMKPQEFDVFLAKERTRWAAVVEQNHITLE